jgi:hypothetical protein
MWRMLTTYVDEFFADHPDITLDPEIQAMSRDLQDHAINKTPGAMEISNVADLKQLCAYVIFQAIFYHAWVHWNGYDDFIPVLKYDPGIFSPFPFSPSLTYLNCFSESTSTTSKGTRRIGE